MRILGGRLQGRVINVPPSSSLHPMSEKVRGALFNIIGDVTNLSFLDAFSGSGAISLEAASRGCKSVTAIEKNKRLSERIKQAAISLNLPEIKVVNANCRSWSETAHEKFDIVVCDPPYHDLQLSTIELISRHLNSKGLMVLSHPGRGGQAPAVNGVVVVDNRSYGDAALSFYRLET